MLALISVSSDDLPKLAELHDSYLSKELDWRLCLATQWDDTSIDDNSFMRTSAEFFGWVSSQEVAIYGGETVWNGITLGPLMPLNAGLIKEYRRAKFYDRVVWVFDLPPDLSMDELDIILRELRVLGCFTALLTSM